MHGEMRYQVIFTTLGFSRTTLLMRCRRVFACSIVQFLASYANRKSSTAFLHINISRSSVDAKASVFISARHIDDNLKVSSLLSLDNLQQTLTSLSIRALISHAFQIQSFLHLYTLFVLILK